MLPDIPNPLITIKSPENEGENGIIVIYKTSSSIDAAIRSAQLFSSPWATIESTAMDSEGYIDLSQMADIYVIAQDGVPSRSILSKSKLLLSLLQEKSAINPYYSDSKQPLLILEVSFLQITVV